MAPPKVTVTIEYIEGRCTRNPDTGCLLWLGAARSNGTDLYGRIKFNGRDTTVHRAMYALHHGHVADDLVIDHKCRVTLCCNPDHLEAVSQQENVMRGRGLAAENAKKTHCKNGHLLSGDNLLEWQLLYNRRRICKICAHQVYAKANQRKRQSRIDDRLRRGLPADGRKRPTTPTVLP